MSCAVDFLRRKMDMRLCRQNCQDSHTGFTQGMANLKVDTNYENDVSSTLTQAMEALSNTLPCLEPSSPTQDETFYRRIDEIYEKAVISKKNSFDLPHGNTVKFFKKHSLLSPQIIETLSCYNATETFQEVLSKRSRKVFRETAIVVQ